MNVYLILVSPLLKEAHSSFSLAHQKCPHHHSCTLGPWLSKSLLEHNHYKIILITKKHGHLWTYSPLILGSWVLSLHVWCHSHLKKIIFFCYICPSKFWYFLSRILVQLRISHILLRSPSFFFLHSLLNYDLAFLFIDSYSVPHILSSS